VTALPQTSLPGAGSASRASEVELFSVAGMDGHLREVNEPFATLLGLSAAQAQDLSLLELVHPDDLGAVVAALAALEAGAEEVLLDNRFVQQGGSTVHLEWVARPVPGSDLWWAAGRDTTRLHLLLAQSLDLRAGLDLALGQTVAALWDLDVRAGLFSWEPQAADLLGLPADALPADAHALAAAVHPNDSDRVLAAVEGLLTAGATEVELRVGADVTTRHLSLRGKVLDRDRRGRPTRAVGLVLDITAEKAMEEQMLRMVMSDALTGVPNRRAFDQALRSEWRRCTRAAEPLSVLMVDIDDFKSFNDTFGHPVGDAALCSVARALTGSLQRAGDVLARFGGEEFAVVLPGIDADGAKAVADRLVAAARQVSVRQAANRSLSVSVGVSTWLPGATTTKSAELLAQADLALYEAKAAGKDQARARPCP
jgi:diguanylate cyclase (GGDEF)-like protein/PAS domain S-box-containing protein